MAAPARKATLKKSRPCEACRDMKKNRMSALQNPFTGPIAAEYDVLRLMCPNAATLAKKIGDRVAEWRSDAGPIDGFEIGCGTGISTLAALSARGDLKLTAIDSAGEMLIEQANQSRRLRLGGPRQIYRSRCADRAPRAARCAHGCRHFELRDP